MIYHRGANKQLSFKVTFNKSDSPMERCQPEVKYVSATSANKQLSCNRLLLLTNNIGIYILLAALNVHTCVAVPHRNWRVIRRLLRWHRWAWSIVFLNFRWGWAHTHFVDVRISNVLTKPHPQWKFSDTALRMQWWHQNKCLLTTAPDT